MTTWRRWSRRRIYFNSGFLLVSTRHRVISAPAHRVAAQQPPTGQQRPLEDAVVADGLAGILGASGQETASCGLRRGYGALIEAYKSKCCRFHSLIFNPARPKSPEAASPSSGKEASMASARAMNIASHPGCTGIRRTISLIRRRRRFRNTAPPRDFPTAKPKQLSGMPLGNALSTSSLWLQVLPSRYIWENRPRPWSRARGFIQRASLQRPFSRLRWITARPARVFIRERKPCTRCRRLFFG